MKAKNILRPKKGGALVGQGDQAEVYDLVDLTTQCRSITYKSNRNTVINQPSELGEYVYKKPKILEDESDRKFYNTQIKNLVVEKEAILHLRSIFNDEELLKYTILDPVYFHATCDNNEFPIFRKFDGNVQQLVTTTLEFDTCKTILDDCLPFLERLNNSGYLYNDGKLDNIFYKDEDGRRRYVVGDYGMLLNKSLLFNYNQKNKIISKEPNEKLWDIKMTPMTPMMHKYDILSLCDMLIKVVNPNNKEALKNLFEPFYNTTYDYNTSIKNYNAEKSKVVGGHRNYASLTIKQLQEIAKTRKIKYSKLRKNELISAITVLKK